mmetsp:Transcript_3801/g.10926  ORF Transcript_3801/g.10926 Transcript_3801/m.10926 type:complete len:249 (-) Transcript_3801:292-1038(-)
MRHFSPGVLVFAFVALLGLLLLGHGFFRLFHFLSLLRFDARTRLHVLLPLRIFPWLRFNLGRDRTTTGVALPKEKRLHQLLAREEDRTKHPCIIVNGEILLIPKRCLFLRMLLHKLHRLAVHIFAKPGEKIQDTRKLPGLGHLAGTQRGTPMPRVELPRVLIQFQMLLLLLLVVLLLRMLCLGRGRPLPFAFPLLPSSYFPSLENVFVILIDLVRLRDRTRTARTTWTDQTWTRVHCDRSQRAVVLEL